MGGLLHISHGHIPVLARLVNPCEEGRWHVGFASPVLENLEVLLRFLEVAIEGAEARELGQADRASGQFHRFAAGHDCIVDIPDAGIEVSEYVVGEPVIRVEGDHVLELSDRIFDATFSIGCPEDGTLPDGRIDIHDDTYIVFDPPCADTDAIITVKGYNFPVGAIARINLVKESGQKVPFKLAESAEVDAEVSDESTFDIDSAGGFTVLKTLEDYPGVFKAGANLYGVANQFTLVADTHKFEERYSDSLLGALPEAAEIYRERSPVFFANKIQDPIIIFQGEDDQVVPQNQSDEIVAALRRGGVPHEYHLYPGEGHGFRKTETTEQFYTTLEKFLKTYVIFG